MMTAPVPPETEGLRRQRIQRANHALQRLGVWHQPAHREYRHAPFCPQGDRCCCSRKWIEVAR